MSTPASSLLSSPPNDPLNPGTALYRLSHFYHTQTANFTSTQALVDQGVTHFVDGVFDAKTGIALLGGGMANSVGRLGVMTLGQRLGSGPVVSALVRGTSHLAGIAVESAVFAGVNHGFDNPRFGKNWAHAAATLGSLKVIPGLFPNQNIVLCHLTTDLGMVGGEHLAYHLNVGEKPEGDFTTQLARAEGVNWQMKGTLSVLRSFSPSLHAINQSMDLSLQSQSRNPAHLEIFGPLGNQALAAKGGFTALLSPTHDVIPIFLSKGEEIGKGIQPGPTASGERWSRIQDFFWAGSGGLVEMSLAHQAAFEFALKQGKVSVVIKEEGVKIGYHRGQGFWIQALEAPGVRVLRLEDGGNRVDILKPVQRSFLREGDIVQIKKNAPFVFKDLSLPAFRGGHRYPVGKMPSEVIRALQSITGSKYRPEYNILYGGLRVSFHTVLGMSLQPISSKIPLTIYSARGGEETVLVNPQEPKQFFVRDGDVVQFGSEAPFIVKLPPSLSGPTGTLQGRKISCLIETPKPFVNLMMMAIQRPNKWIPGSGPEMPIRVLYDPQRFLLRIAYKGAQAEQRIYVTAADTQFFGQGEVGFDFRHDRILQFGEEGTPWQFRWKDVEARRLEIHREREQARREQEAREQAQREADLRRQQEAWERERREAQARREQEARERAQREAEARRQQGAHQGRGQRRNQGSQGSGGSQQSGPQAKPFRSNFYPEEALSLLGLRRSDIQSERDVKRVYRKLARQAHPDRNPQDPNAADKFKKLMEAYQVICRDLNFEPTIH